MNGADRDRRSGADSDSGTETASADTGPVSLGPRGYLLLGAATLLGLAHHVDHVVRGNHVGWPLTAEITPFTYSLLIYPLIAVGFARSLTGRGDAGYWTVVMTLGAGMLVFFHLSPWAVEPPGDVILPYADPAVGYAAFGILIALIAAVAAGALYSAWRWSRGRTR
jgi:hypothetical protein